MNDKIIVSKLNEVFLNIECSQEQSMELREYFSVYTPNYKFHPKFKMHIWNGKISFYKDNTIPIGLLAYLISFCEKFKYELVSNIDTSKLSNNISDEEFKIFFDKILPSTGKYQLRDYQEIAIKRLLRDKRGVIQYATSSGKSLIIYALIKYLKEKLDQDKKILLIVPTTSLVLQMTSDFKDYGYQNINDDMAEIYYSSDNKSLSKKIIVSTWQSAQKMSTKLYNSVGAVICDEVHTAGFKSKIVSDILSRCVNAEYRVGDSGTLPKDICNLLTIYGYLGGKIAEVKSKDLMERGLITNLKIINVIAKYPDSMIKKSSKRSMEVYHEEVAKIQNYKDRNKIFKHIISKINSKQNILILVREIDHINTIEGYIRKQFPDKIVRCIWGETNPKLREQIRQEAEIKEGMVIISTYSCFATGISIKNLTHVIFGISALSEIKIIQAIGRSLRQHANKKCAYLWDVVDDMTWRKRTGKLGTNYIYDQWLKRLEYYKNQEFSCSNVRLNISDI